MLYNELVATLVDAGANPRLHSDTAAVRAAAVVERLMALLLTELAGGEYDPASKVDAVVMRRKLLPAQNPWGDYDPQGNLPVVHTPGGMHPISVASVEAALTRALCARGIPAAGVQLREVGGMTANYDQWSGYGVQVNF